MSDPSGYYAALGLTSDASAEDIKTAYRALARKYHPDLNKEPGAEAQFKRVQEAYDVLSDTNERVKYDRPRTSRYTNFHDIVGDMFRSSVNPGGQDIHKTFTVTLEEICSGTIRNIEIATNKVCTTCRGDGVKDGCSKKPCSRCQGRGSVSHSRHHGSMQMQFTTPCGLCNGKGSSIPDEDKCLDCKGSGLVSSSKRIMVTIPQGARPGVRYVRKQEGLLSTPTGRRGDAIFDIEYKEHDLFKIRGGQIVLDVSITFSQAAVGAKVEFPTLYGKQELEVLPGTESGQVYYFKNLGLTNPDGSRGPLLVRVCYKIPKLTESEHSALLASLKNLEDENSIPDHYRKMATFVEYLNDQTGEKS